MQNAPLDSTPAGSALSQENPTIPYSSPAGPILIGLLGPALVGYSYYSRGVFPTNGWLPAVAFPVLALLIWWGGRRSIQHLKKVPLQLPGGAARFVGTAARLKLARPKRGYLFLSNGAVIFSCISTTGDVDDVIIPLKDVSTADLSLGRLRINLQAGGDWLFNAPSAKLWVKEINQAIGDQKA